MNQLSTDQQMLLSDSFFLINYLHLEILTDVVSVSSVGSWDGTAG